MADAVLSTTHTRAALGVYAIKQDDTAPALAASLRSRGAPLDLTLADTVTVHMQHVDALKTVSGACDITDEEKGRIAYPWADGDTDTPGTYRVEFEIDFLDGTKQTVPDDGWVDVVVLPKLA